MRVLLSGDALLEALTTCAGSEVFTFEEEPCVAKAAMSFSRPAAACAWVVASSALDERGLSAVAGIRRWALPIHIIALLEGPWPECIRSVWQLAALGAEAASNPMEAIAKLESLREPGSRFVHQLLACLGTSGGLGVHLVKLLDREAETLGETAEEIASRLGMSRPTFFRRHRAQRLPRLEDLQSLFRLRRAVSMLKSGAPIDSIACLTGFADPPSLRRALRRKLGVSIAEARRRDGVEWIIDAWLATQATRPETSRVASCKMACKGETLSPAR